MLMKTFFRGDTQKFPWERFLVVHFEANRIFEDINEPLTESMKVMYLNFQSLSCSRRKNRRPQVTGGRLIIYQHGVHITTAKMI